MSKFYIIIETFVYSAYKTSPFRLTVKIDMQRLLTKVNKVRCVSDIDYSFSIIVI